VLRSATVWPAAALGMSEHLGTVAPGKLADLTIINGDPLNRTMDLVKVAGVVTNGRYYIIDELLR
jgi:imidazolonepropionase-like amidohydrolase